jgi:hypothetical protein
MAGTPLPRGKIAWGVAFPHARGWSAGHASGPFGTMSKHHGDAEPDRGQAAGEHLEVAQLAAAWPHNREHDLRSLPEASPPGVPGRHLVRLSASAVDRGCVRSAAELGQAGLRRSRQDGSGDGE